MIYRIWMALTVWMLKNDKFDGRYDPLDPRWSDKNWVRNIALRTPWQEAQIEHVIWCLERL